MLMHTCRREQAWGWGPRKWDRPLARLQVIEALYTEEAKAAGKIKTFVCA